MVDDFVPPDWCAFFQTYIPTKIIATRANTPPIEPPTITPIGALDPCLEEESGDVEGFDDGVPLELGLFRLEGGKEVVVVRPTDDTVEDCVGVALLADWTALWVDWVLLAVVVGEPDGAVPIV